MTGSPAAAIVTSGARPSQVGQSADGYLAACPSLSDELAELAEDSDHRPLLRHERDRLETAVYLCATAIRLRRPAAFQAALDGRLEE